MKIPEVSIQQSPNGSYFVAGWYDFDRWARNNVALWNNETQRVTHCQLSEEDRLRLISAHLLRALSDMNEKAVSLAREYAQPFMIVSDDSTKQQP